MTLSGPQQRIPGTTQSSSDVLGLIVSPDSAAQAAGSQTDVIQQGTSTSDQTQTPTCGDQAPGADIGGALGGAIVGLGLLAAGLAASGGHSTSEKKGRSSYSSGYSGSRSYGESRH